MTATLSRRPLVAVVGPTASGKTDLALRLAERFDGEIVGADSRQVFMGMDIGTAKPAPEQRRGVPHHLIDVVKPDETLGLQRYLDLALRALDDIWARGKLPLLVGGTGQYVWALLDGWSVPRVPPQPQLRAELAARAERDGLGALQRELAALDPEAAGRVDQKNLRRLVRAIEVATVRGLANATVSRRLPPAWHTVVLGIDMPREALYERIDARVEAMLCGGLVDEVRRLRLDGYGGAFAMTGIGYREVCAHLDGQRPLDAVADKMRAATHRLARTQYGWFRRGDPRIRWLAPERAFDEAVAIIETALSAAVAERASR